MKIYKRFCALLLALLAAALLLPVGASAAGSIDLGHTRKSDHHCGLCGHAHFRTAVRSRLSPPEKS